jgi:uncharacterized protein YbgA (DUF1722 family)/uncharacterized protein YbbK (DUF523 family)
VANPGSPLQLRIGVSACLLGEEVRYDGGHKRNPFLVEVLGRFAEWVPVCPEAEAGFGTPRPAMHLVANDGGADASRLKLLTVRDHRDLTAPMRALATRRAAHLATMNLDGYVLKKDSPSCGLLRVKVYAAGGSNAAIRNGRGLFADALCRAMPLLPVEEEGRLADPRLRENFIERLFAYRRLRELVASVPRAADLVGFHTRHKLLLLAHAPRAYATLGRLVAGARSVLSKTLLADYSAGFMEALTAPATRGRHANVLQHRAGYFRRLADEPSRRGLAESIADYRAGLVPLVVPVTLIAHYARLHRVEYLLGQVYLQPHPKELMLRNHV